MAKSRNRGGAKAHRKRVQKRNEKLGIQKKQFQKAFSQMYESKMKELQEQFDKLSAMTESRELLETNNETQVIENKEVEVSSTTSETTTSN